MPIYEFRCVRCGHVFELLKLKKGDEEVVMRCPKCKSQNVERALSRIGGIRSRSRSGGVTRTIKECGGSTCATIDVPGPEK
ncbi:MAG: zinc ribbon domain-containing protein [Nitrospirae bacterium]|nr:zinc ribbon domain-containing protein [Nitrospirota bacterium]